MRRGGLLKRAGWLGKGAVVRQPHHGQGAAPARPFTRSELIDDARTLRQIIQGLERIRQRVADTEIVRTAEERGYLEPEEDDRVRRELLAYRNYRLALYDLILRHENYPGVEPGDFQLKAFLVAFVAALTLYAKSLLLDELASRSRLIRAKLNEPEPKFELEEGFFDEVMAGFCSLRNYGLIVRALWFWSTHRRTIRSLARLEPDPWGALEKLAMSERHAAQSALSRVLRSRLKLGWRIFWQSAFKPVERIRYGVRSRVGGRFAGHWLHPDQHRSLNNEMFHRLSLGLRPGDVLLMRSEGKLTAALLPGFWAHAAIFLGDRDDLSALSPALAAEVGEDLNGGFVIEAVSPQVRVVSLKSCLDADHVFAVRPRLPTDSIHEALVEALMHLGKPYDFEFDFNLSNRIVCTGLVYRVYHGRGSIKFNLIKRLGRFTLTGDDLAQQAMAASAAQSFGFEAEMLVLRRPEGWRFVDEAEQIRTLVSRIERGWRPIRS